MHLWLFQLTEYPVYILREGAGEFDVYVDGENVCRCKTIAMALGLYAICFYVFNLSFLDNSIKTLLFLQKFAFQLHDHAKNSRVMRMYRVCNALMDKVSKTAYNSRKSKAKSKARLAAGGKVKPCPPVAPEAAVCSKGVEVKKPLRAHSVKRTRKLPLRLKE